MIRNLSRAGRPILSPTSSVLLAIAASYGLPTRATAEDGPRFVDLSLLVAPEYP